MVWPMPSYFNSFVELMKNLSNIIYQEKNIGHKKKNKRFIVQK